MIVVPVLMTNCQVSLKPNIGPVIIHAAMMQTASTNTLGRPQKCAATLANREYQAVLCILDLSLCYLTLVISGKLSRYCHITNITRKNN